MNDTKREQAKSHSLYIENRKKITLTGVTDTDKFNESCVQLYTNLGELTVKGKALQVTMLSVETGDMVIEGDIDAVIYGDGQVKGPLGFFGRLTK
ncbi:MAG: sporulation protein YabP [Ruminococcus sp.]|nr:sporulation protein YabP [Ruminococcus sp.]